MRHEGVPPPENRLITRNATTVALITGDATPSSRLERHHPSRKAMAWASEGVPPPENRLITRNATTVALITGDATPSSRLERHHPSRKAMAWLARACRLQKTGRPTFSTIPSGAQRNSLRHPSGNRCAQVPCPLSLK